MLKHLLKSVAQPQPTTKKETQLSTTVPQDNTANFEALQVSLAQFVAENTQLKAEVGSLKATLQAQVEAAAKAKLDARKEKLQAAVGTDKSDSLMLATASLDDAAFETVLSSFSVSLAAEARSPLFTETGTQAAAAKASYEQDSVSRLAALMQSQLKSQQ